MYITDVNAVLLTGPSSHDPWITFAKKTRSAAFVEIHTDAGLTGLGETYAGYFGPELVPPVIDYIRPILTGGQTTDPRVLGQRMRTSLAYLARVGVVGGIISAVEAALWDLEGKAQGVPVYELLGGRQHDRLFGYATGGPSPAPLEALFRKAHRYRELGFSAFKIGSGYLDMETRYDRSADPAEPAAVVAAEVDKIARLRAELGPDFGIALDGHMGGGGAKTWDLELALQVVTALDGLSLLFFEEPLPYEDPDAYAALTRATSTPIAGGEQLSSLDEFRLWLSRDAFDIAQPDASWVGIADFVEIGALAAARGRRVASHNWCAGGGVMQNVHAAFATPATSILELIPDAGELHTRVWGDSLVMDDRGFVLPPQAPGLGITLDDEIKERFPFRPGHEEFAGVPGKVLTS